jgi:hypothetical protein
VQLEVKQPALFFIPCIGGDVVQLEVNNQNYSSFLALVVMWCSWR